MRELNKTYDPVDIEKKIYKDWLDKGYFHAEVNKDKKPFCIVMPPPNITGKLHMGHALDNTIQDILIRYKRMNGYEALWQPGTDHAAIATEVKVIEKLKKDGIDKCDLGREGFLKEAWKWREEYGSHIINQLHKLGASADWERERFTMDEGCSAAVKYVFVKLYEEGYIYKGSRIINWCPCCKTSISDAEVEHKEMEGSFWHIKYPIAGSEDEYVEVATTRPETLLGDTAVAVNPDDERYTHLIGKMLKLPLTDREIPVIADEYVDKDFGTGCVKITPAHDPNDFLVGQRHGLEEINILDDTAHIDLEGSKYHGLERYEARKMMVEDLKEQGLLIAVKPHTHNVGTHDRCNSVVEPMIKPQWFVKMDELAKPAIEAISKKELKFVPESYAKTYLHWLNNIKDWCISRQLWWGHRIPAYYCNDCGHMEVSYDEVKKCPKCSSSNVVQDEDTLDTWFSSALWPFSTLGWPEKTAEYEYFYPTDVLVTAYDIIFFWVVRMVFSGYAHTNKAPFNTVFIHGLIRDSQGRKMSKSLGNGIDPLEIIEKYGADALRMTLVTGNSPGNDMRFYMERVEASRNFANKIWNASRFIMMNIENDDFRNISEEDLCLEDKWILSKNSSVIKDVSENLDKYELGVALSKVYDFLWDEFCDWYIEMVKPRLWDKTSSTRNAALNTLVRVLIDQLKLLHPFMPFITEEIYKNLVDDESSIMVSSWPVYNENSEYEKAEKDVELVKEAIRSIRNVRSNLNVLPSRKSKLYLYSEDKNIIDTFKEVIHFVKNLAYATELIVIDDKSQVDDNMVAVSVPKADIYMPFLELVDVEKEVERLENEKKKLEDELKRVKNMLGNEKFISKAPQSKIDEERAKQEKYESLMAQVISQLEKFRSL